MTASYKKKLIEVATPLEAINPASARKKSIRYGHPSALHEPDKFVLANVEVENGHAGEPRHVRGVLDTGEPPFGHHSIHFDMKSLLARAEVPR